MEEEKKAAAGVDWAEKAPAAPRRRSRKKSAAKGKPKKPAAPAEPKQQPAVSDTPEPPAEPAPAALQVPEAPDAPQPDTIPVSLPEPPETASESAPAQPETTEQPEPAEPAEAALPNASTDETAAAEPAPEDTAPEDAASAEPEQPVPDAGEGAANAPQDAPEEDSTEGDAPEKKARADTIARTAQLSIAQIMAGLADTPAEDTPDAPPAEPDSTEEDTEEEPADTLTQKLGRGVTGMLRWLLLVVLFVLVIACGGVAWLYHNATPDMLPQIKATFDGQELAPTAYKWHVPIVGSWLRRTYAETLNPTPAELALPVSGASPDLVVTPGGYSAQLTITDAAGESIYDGSATGFRSYRFAENGTYDAKLIVSTSGTPADEATVTGTETWQFRFTVSIKPSIQLATDSVVQGGVAAVRVGQTLGQDAPAIKTTLKNVGFVKAGSGWICYLPIPWNQTPGSITLEVSADGYTEPLSLSVRAGSFSYKDYSKTSQMAAPYIGEDDAPAAVSKLFATVDDKIQWSVGGFVQPFLDSFDTPLTYGMTEYAGRSYSERGTNYGYGGRTSTNVIIRPKNGKGSMIAPASGRVLLAKDLGGLYGNTLVIEHGAGLKSIFYGLASLDVKTGDTVKQGQLLGGCSKAVVAEMRIGTVPIDPLAVWRSRCDGLKLY